MTPYLAFDGNCREAFERYAAIFGGEIEAMMPFRDSPIAAEMPEAMHDRVMHARLRVGEKVLMASDDPSGSWTPPNGISVQVAYEDVGEARRVFDALAEGGEVKMPFGQTFWATGFGMVTDRYGIPWLINCEGA